MKIGQGFKGYGNTVDNYQPHYEQGKIIPLARMAVQAGEFLVNFPFSWQ